MNQAKCIQVPTPPSLSTAQCRQCRHRPCPSMSRRVTAAATLAIPLPLLHRVGAPPRTPPHTFLSNPRNLAEVNSRVSPPLRAAASHIGLSAVDDTGCARVEWALGAGAGAALGLAVILMSREAEAAWEGRRRGRAHQRHSPRAGGAGRGGGGARAAGDTNYRYYSRCYRRNCHNGRNRRSA